jgi:hypothetical protein
VNLGSRASYRHGGRGPLPTDPVVTPEMRRGLDLPPNPDIEINPT